MISILTCPRPGGARYVDALLDAITSEVPELDRFVITDTGGYLLHPPNNLAAAWRALAEADARRDWLLFLEDDVLPIAPISRAIDHQFAAGASFASLCRAFHQPLGLRPGVRFMGSQAVLFPAATVRDLAAFGRDRPEALAGVVHFDMAVAVATQHLGLSYEQAPACFEHVGVVSAADPRLDLVNDHLRVKGHLE